MRTWKCEYCDSKNFDDALDCRKCGAPRPEVLYTDQYIKTSPAITHSDMRVLRLKTASAFYDSSDDKMWATS